jgi:hypothetical protein
VIAMSIAIPLQYYNNSIAITIAIPLFTIATTIAIPLFKIAIQLQQMLFIKHSIVDKAFNLSYKFYINHCNTIAMLLQKLLH